MPGDTPKACPSCGANYRDLRWYIRDTWSGMIYRRVSAPIGGESRRCTDEWHDGAPLAFDAAIAALDVEPTHHTDRMVTTYDILGLDAVRAAHRAEVERAVAEEREACAKVVDRLCPHRRKRDCAIYEACAKAIRARGTKS